MKTAWVVLGWVLAMAPCAYAQSAQDVPAEADGKQVCAPSMIAALSDALHPSGLVIGKDDSGERSSTLIAAACKANPADSTQTYVAIAYDAGEVDEKALVLAIMDARSGRVLASYQGRIDEDATLEVQSDSLRIDTARYVLAKGVRAFGLDVSGWSSPNCGDGGVGPQRNLYIREGKRIRKILDGLYLSQWRFIKQGQTRCNPLAPEDAPTIIETTHYTLSVLPGVSHGFHDLRVTGGSQRNYDASAKTSGPYETLRYNGRVYQQEAGPR